MNFLTADNKSGAYDEIQCGLAHTQYESLPMPPHTVWEWLEGYGAIQAQGERIHGEWSEARREVESLLDEKITETALENLLDKTRAMAKSPAEQIVYAMNDGWGSLELVRRNKQGENLMCPHLDFGETGKEQEIWLNLLENGTVGKHNGKDIPLSYMRQKEWLSLLEEAINNKDKENWFAYYLLGTAYVAEERYQEAESLLKKSIELKETAWNDYSLAITYRKTGKIEKENAHILKAYFLRTEDISLAKETFKTLYENNQSSLTLELFENASEKIKTNKRCLLYYAYALAREGKYRQAEDILCGEDGSTYLVVPDIRECELTETQLWFYLQERKGKPSDAIGEPPRDLDFRMFTKREGWI